MLAGLPCIWGTVRKPDVAFRWGYLAAVILQVYAGLLSKSMLAGSLTVPWRYHLTVSFDLGTAGRRFESCCPDHPPLLRHCAFASPSQLGGWRIESFGDSSRMRGPTRYVQRRDNARHSYIIFFI
jgi:hypothetical protein